jgi:hypothetical protein
LTAFEQFLHALPQKFLRPDADLSGMGNLLASLQNQPSPSAPNAAAPADHAPPKDEIRLPIRRDETKYGRNDLVIIRRGPETQTVKYKKAEPLLMSGWTITGKAGEK